MSTTLNVEEIQESIMPKIVCRSIAVEDKNVINKNNEAEDKPLNGSVSMSLSRMAAIWPHTQ